MLEKSSSLAEIEVVYRSREADFFRLALAKTGDPEAARDAVQDGFAQAIRGRRSYQGKGSLDAWVARCVINAAHDVRRAARATDVGQLTWEPVVAKRQNVVRHRQSNEIRLDSFAAKR